MIEHVCGGQRTALFFIRRSPPPLCQSPWWPEAHRLRLDWLGWPVCPPPAPPVLDYTLSHISFKKITYNLFCIILGGGMCTVEVRGQLSGVDFLLPLWVLRIELRLSGLCSKQAPYPLNHLDGPHIQLFCVGSGAQTQDLVLGKHGLYPPSRPQSSDSAF